MMRRLGIALVLGILVVVSWVVAGFVAHGLVHAAAVGWDLWSALATA